MTKRLGQLSGTGSQCLGALGTQVLTRRRRGKRVSFRTEPGFGCAVRTRTKWCVEVLSRIHPKPHGFWAPCEKPLRTCGGNTETCAFPRSPPRFHPESWLKTPCGFGWIRESTSCAALPAAQAHGAAQARHAHLRRSWATCAGSGSNCSTARRVLASPAEQGKKTRGNAGSAQPSSAQPSPAQPSPAQPSPACCEDVRNEKRRLVGSSRKERCVCCVQTHAG